MRPYFFDILSRIDATPTWFDENAVPRYCIFEPNKSANFYVEEIALAEISCQQCSHIFKVAFSSVNFPEKTIAEAIHSKTLHYGDPPNMQCCDAGPSMNSVPKKVIEYWVRHEARFTGERYGVPIVTDLDGFQRWRRDASLEIEIEPERAK